MTSCGISLAYLNTNALKKFGKAIINDDDGTKSKTEFDQALDAFEKSLNAAANIVILRQDEVVSREKTLNFLSEMDFKVVQDDIRKKRKSGTGNGYSKRPSSRNGGKEKYLFCGVLD
jgi:hypothetical protein